MKDINKLISDLKKLETGDMTNNDFLLTWEKTDDEIQATFLVADALRALREKNISTKIFDSGLAISYLEITRLERVSVFHQRPIYLV